MKREDSILFRPWKELKGLQNKKLRYFITRHLYPFSPYYRQLFDRHKIKPGSIKSVGDLRRIPFTSKSTFLGLIQKDPARGDLELYLKPTDELIKKFLPRTELAKFLIASIFKGKSSLKKRLEEEYKPVFLTATAGTTHRPVSFLYTRYDIENLYVYGKRLIEIFGIKGGNLAVNVFPYAPHLAFWQTVFAGVAAGEFILSTGGGKILGTEGNIQAILKIKPKFLIGVPNYVYHILKTAREENLKMDFLNRIVLGAARVTLGFKQKLARLLNEMGASDVLVFGTYGFTEARAAWGECPVPIGVSSGYHTYPDKEVFEIIDPESGEVKREGEDGEIVYSNIDSRGTCVLRYRTGDIVKGGIVYSPCPYCARRVPRLSSDISRTSNIKSFQFSKIKGTVVNLNDVGHILDEDADIDEWQIEITKRGDDPYDVDELNLYVSLLKDIDKDKFAEALNQRLLSHEEVSFNRINFVTRDEIKHRIEIESSVKAKKIVDRRPEA